MLSEVKYIDQNIVYKDDGSVWAFYRLPMQEVMSVDFEKKEQYSMMNTRLFEEFTRYGYVCLAMLPDRVNLEDIFIKMEHSFVEDAFDYGCSLLDRTYRDFTKEREGIFGYEWILSVPLSNVLSWTKEWKQNVAMMKEYVLKGLGLYSVKIDPKMLERFRQKEREVYAIVSGFRGSSLSRSEMLYYYRQFFARGLMVKGDEVEEANISETVFDIHFGKVKLETAMNADDCISYSSYLPLSQTQDQLYRNDLCELVQYCNYPVSLFFHLRFERSEGTFGLTDRSLWGQKQLEEVMEGSVAADGDVDETMLESFTALKRLKEESKKKQFVSWSVTAVITDTEEMYLDSKVSHFLSFMKDNHLIFVRGGFDQMDLMFQTFPGSFIDRGKRYWEQLSTVADFCQCLPFTGKQIGTRSGFYIGRMDNNFERAKDLQTAISCSRIPVLLNPLVINKGLKDSLTDSPHIAVTGKTGKGKSFLMKMFHMYLSSVCKTLYIDPKAEIRKRFEAFLANEDHRLQYPILCEHLEQNFNFVTVDYRNQDNYGILDPLLFADVEESKTLMENIIEMLYQTDKDHIKLAIHQAINDVVERRYNGEAVGFYHVLDHLRENRDAEIRAAGELLLYQVKGSILELVFSYGDAAFLDCQAQNTILEIAGIDLPSDKKEKYERSEIYSNAVMACIGKFCKMFGEKDPTEETVIFVDEALVFQTSQIGHEIFKSMTRVGRSQNNMLVYGTQSILDLKISEDGNNYGMIFAFDEPSQREQILDFLGLESDELHQEWLGNTVKGQCLFLDHKGRVGKLSIHCIFNEWLELFATVDQTGASMLEDSLG